MSRGEKRTADKNSCSDGPFRILIDRWPVSRCLLRRRAPMVCTANSTAVPAFEGRVAANLALFGCQTQRVIQAIAAGINKTTLPPAGTPAPGNGPHGHDAVPTSYDAAQPCPDNEEPTAAGEKALLVMVNSRLPLWRRRLARDQGVPDPRSPILNHARRQSGRRRTTAQTSTAMLRRSSKLASNAAEHGAWRCGKLHMVAP